MLTADAAQISGHSLSSHPVCTFVFLYTKVANSAITFVVVIVGALFIVTNVSCMTGFISVLLHAVFSNYPCSRIKLYSIICMLVHGQL